MKPANLTIVLGILLMSGAALAQPVPPPGEGPPGPPPGGFPPMPSMAETRYEAAIVIRDGDIAGKPGAMVKGKVAQPTEAAGLAVVSSAPALNALIVSGGKSAFTLKNSRIALSGPGTNDFLGTGAGVLVRDRATLVLDGVTIETNARISSAAVAAEEATLRIYNSRLVANGGPLPAGYKPVIGPGMMEPPAPLGLVGTARTLLAMSNSRTFIYDSQIEADGWGALSTDATGGNLYLEANDSTIAVRRDGYGTYADFGAHVAINRSRIDSGGVMGIIAGKARIDFSGVSGRAAENVMMIHSVMAFDPAETAEFNLKDAKVAAGQAAILVKSANARIAILGGTIASDSGVLLDVRKNDDPNATLTRGAKVPGVTLAISHAQLTGDVVDSDPDRETAVSLTGAQLTGALREVVLSLDPTSHWQANGNSNVTFGPGMPIAAIDAPTGVTIQARSADPGLTPGTTRLPGGGELIVSR